MIVPARTAAVLYRATQLLRGRAGVFSHLAELQANERLSEAALDDLQWDKTRRLLEHARDHTPYYAALFSRHGIDVKRVCELRDLSAIPLLTKDILRRHAQDLVSRDKRATTGASWASSSGSTGQPVAFLQSRDFALRARAHQLRNYAWCGYRVGDRFTLFWGSELYFRSKQLIDNVEHAITNRREFNTFRLTPQMVDRYADHIMRFRPTLISSYPSSLHVIARHLAGRGLKPQPCVVQATSEVLTPELRAFFAEHLNARVFDKYGSRETNVIAHECPHHEGMHINVENTLVEFLGPDGAPVQPGSRGDVVVTNLNNHAMPLIRFAIGDLGVPLEGTCSCGIRLRRMASLGGRVVDMIRTEDGSVVDAYLFSYLLMKYPCIHTFQVVQDRLSRVVIRIRLETPAPEGFEREVRRRVQEHTGPALDVDIEYVAEIPLAASGKHRTTISLLAPPP